MKTAINLLLLLHGLIHLMGFLAAHQLIGSDLLPIAINRSTGAFWLAASVLFGITLVLLWVGYPRWPVWAFVAVLLSQVLIILVWKVAWAGTILNGLILLLSVVYFGQNEFRLKLKSELATMSAAVIADEARPIVEADLLELPPPVRKWLSRVGIIGRKPMREVHLTQRLQMKLKPEQKNWSEGRAVQRIFCDPPGFHWSVEVRMNPFIGFLGRDKWEKGTGFMSIKLLGLVPVVKQADNPRIDEAALQRYLAEIVWCPSVALSPHLEWFPLDEHSARAVLTYRGTSGEGIFTFDEQGDFSFFSAQRYKDNGEGGPRIPWRVVCDAPEVRKGIRIPTKCRASWEMEGEEWTWLHLEVEEYTP